MSLTARIEALTTRVATEFGKVPYHAAPETISGLWNFATAPTIQGNTVYHAGNSNLNTVNWTVADATTQYHAVNKGQLDSKISKVSLTDNAVVRADGTTGAVQNSGVIIDDSNNINLPTGSTYRINNTQISSANLSNDANITKYDAATKTFTGTGLTTLAGNLSLPGKYIQLQAAYRRFSFTDGTNLNITGGGTYYLSTALFSSGITPAGTSLPSGNNNISGIIFGHSVNDGQTQLAVGGSNGEFYKRRSSAVDTFESWKMFYNEGNSNLSTVDWAANNITAAGTIQATTAKLTNLTDGYLPYHISDANGLGNSGLFWDGTKLGISKTNPFDKLDINGAVRVTGSTAGGEGSWSVMDYSSTGIARFITNGPDVVTRGSYSWTIRRSDGGGELTPFVLSSSGNVGIGTTTTPPESLISVVKSNSGGIGGEISIVNNATDAIGNSAVLNFGLGTTTYGGNDGNAQLKAELQTGSITDFILTSWSGAAWVERWRVKGNGNFLINTTTDDLTNKLQINGSIRATTACFTNGAAANTIAVGDANGYLSWSTLAAAGIAATNHTHAYTDTRLRANAYSYLTGDVTIQQGDNISITQSGSVITVNMPVSYEPSFSKNSAFNKNFGTTAGTVLEGRTFGTAANSATTDFAAAVHTHAYDNYGGWSLLANGMSSTSVLSGGTVNFIQGTNVSISKSGNDITINVPTIGVMVYPAAGIAVSTGSAWGTSIANNSANWNTAYDNMYKVGLGYFAGGFKMSPSEFWYDASDFIVLQKTDVISSGNQYPATSHGVFNALSGKEDSLGNPSTNGYVLSSQTNGIRSWIAMAGGSYTLPLAENGTRGGIQIGYSASGVYLPLQLSSEKGYIALTQSAMQAAITSQFEIAQSMKATSFELGTTGWTIEVSDGVLVFKLSGVAKASLDSSGNLKATEIYRGGA